MESMRRSRTSWSGDNGDNGSCMVCRWCGVECDESGHRSSDGVTYVIVGRRCSNDGCIGEDEDDFITGYGVSWLGSRTAAMFVSFVLDVELIDDLFARCCGWFGIAMRDTC